MRSRHPGGVSICGRKRALLCLCQDVGNVGLARHEGEHEHETCHIIAQAFSRAKNVLRLLESYRVERAVDAAVRVREDARRSIRRKKEIMEKLAKVDTFFRRQDRSKYLRFCRREGH